MSEHPLVLALWGLLGAAWYALQKLVTALLAEQEPTPRQARRAWSECVIAILFGPGAAVALTPLMIKLAPAATPAAAAVGIGLAANACRPIIDEVLLPTLRRAVGGYLKELGSNLTGDKT